MQRDSILAPTFDDLREGLIVTENGQLTVLTVDDNDILRYTMKRMLSDAGYRVIEARTGGEALNRAKELPDLITLDIDLPDIDGFQVCARLKADPITSRIPVLHVSGTFVEPEHRVRGLQGGADAYLAEPVDRAELIATIEALLRIKQSEKMAHEEAMSAHFERAEVQLENVHLDERVRARTAELEAKSEEIRKLHTDLMRSQDDERRKIARDLHDSTGQMLAVLNINLTRLLGAKELSADSRALAVESSNLAGELSSQLRTVSYLLHPPLLDELGLESALQWLVDGFVKRSGIAVRMDVSKNFGRLTPDMEIILFRIVQECLTNVHRHSGSKSAAIDLRRSTRSVTLNIADQGRKFETDHTKVRPGTGLLGMRERVRQFGGWLNVDFSKEGTTVTAEIPASADVEIRDAQ
jgi:signal transduction histidine kinase